MAFRATLVSHEPLDYFMKRYDDTSRMRISDVVLRVNKDPKKLFPHLIRLATQSQWSHSALLYLISDPYKGYENTFLVDAMTSGIRVESWRKEVVPFKRFTVGIKRPCLDWYVETPKEQAEHDRDDPEDTKGIAFLRHVRGIAFDQIDGMYDHKVVAELTARYIDRILKKRLPEESALSEGVEKVADLFKKWDESASNRQNVMRFICSGLVQYAFFEALRVQLMHDFAIPAHREAATRNLQNMTRIIFREDPEQAIPRYIQQIQSGQLHLSDQPPEDVLDLLKTATPADFGLSDNLAWRYIILKGVVWQIDRVSDDYQPASKAESEVLALLK